MRIRIVVIAAYVIGWSLCFRIGLFEAGGALTEPSVGLAFAVLFVGIHLVLGVSSPRRATLLLPLLMVPVALVARPWIPLDSDIPGWRGIVVWLVALIGVPSAAMCIAAGMALRWVRLRRGS